MRGHPWTRVSMGERALSAPRARTTRAKARRAIWRVNSKRSENWSGRIHFARTQVKSWGPQRDMRPVGAVQDGDIILFRFNV